MNLKRKNLTIENNIFAVKKIINQEIIEIKAKDLRDICSIFIDLVIKKLRIFIYI